MDQELSWFAVVKVPAVLKAGMRFVLSRGSPNGPWQVSSSFSTSLVERKREIEPEFYGRGSSSELKEPSAPAKSSVAGFMYNSILTQPQLQAEKVALDFVINSLISRYSLLLKNKKKPLF